MMALMWLPPNAGEGSLRGNGLCGAVPLPRGASGAVVGFVACPEDASRKGDGVVAGASVTRGPPEAQ